MLIISSRLHLLSSHYLPWTILYFQHLPTTQYSPPSSLTSFLTPHRLFGLLGVLLTTDLQHFCSQTPHHHYLLHSRETHNLFSPEFNMARILTSLQTLPLVPSNMAMHFNPPAVFNIFFSYPSASLFPFSHSPGFLHYDLIHISSFLVPSHSALSHTHALPLPPTPQLSYHMF